MEGLILTAWILIGFLIGMYMASQCHDPGDGATLIAMMIVAWPTIIVALVLFGVYSFFFSLACLSKKIFRKEES